MKRFLLMCTAAVAGLAQQSAPPPTLPLAPGEEVRLLEIKNNAFGVQQALSRVFPGVTSTQNTLIIRGQASVLDMVEAAARKLDVPPPPSQPPRVARTVELTMYLLLGSTQESTRGSAPSSDLDSTVRQLKTVFPYKTYRLLDVEVMRGGQSSKIAIEGSLPGGLSMFSFSTSPYVYEETTPATVGLGGLDLRVREKVDGTFYESKISTSLSAREGQKTVIGKANVTNSEDAIILVVTPRIE